MASLAGFLDRLVSEGRVVFRDAPRGEPSADDRAKASARLGVMFDNASMELAGPPLRFDERSALAAAGWAERACWFLVSRGEPAEVVDRALRLPPPPGSASEHLSADLTFRYLPAVHRRARAIDPGDLLSSRLAEALRRWPLSGVLADLEQGPTSPIDFEGHAGLLLLFAERWAAHPKPSWTPAEASGRDWLGMALDAIGSPRPYFLEDDASKPGTIPDPGPRPSPTPGGRS
jgi:hypothetical protein